MIKKLTLSLLLFNLFSATSYPMAANPITRQAAKELLKKGIEKGATVLHWAIAAGPLWSEAWQRGGYSDDKGLEEEIALCEHNFLNRNVKSEKYWIREELKKQGFKNWENIRIVPYVEWSCFRRGLKEQILLYPAGDINQSMGWLFGLKKLLCLEDKNVHEKMRGYLSHEKAHLEQRHSEQKLVLCITLPFIMNEICKKICTPFRNSFDNSFVIKNFSKIITGATKYMLSSAALWSVGYLHEKMADEGIINDPKVLEALAHDFKRDAAILKAAKEYQNYSSISFGSHWLHLHRIVDCHPNPLKRTKRCEERAAQLRAAQQKI